MDTHDESAAAVEAAKARAEAAATAAQAAKNDAAASNAAALTAKGNAETAAASARSAKTRAETAANASEVAKGSAEAFSTAAQTAKANVEAFSNAADAAKTRAETAASAAEAAKVNAEAFSTAAQTAKANAESSATDADTAKDDAETAKDETVTAKEKAASAATQADLELVKATTAAQKAEIEAKKAAEAHHLSTIIGLAGAFTERARAARISQYVWVFILASTLGFLAYIGSERFPVITALIQDLLAKSEPIGSIVGAQLLLSGITIAPPIWLAWLSSSMISKYFHLSEDYSYKAAIAKAYMGFKEQAEGLDDIFEERLFAAAITQLDSNPLRFIDSAEHPGSPLQDLLQQPFMNSAMDNTVFKNEVASWLNRAFKSKFYTPKINITVNQAKSDSTE